MQHSIEELIRRINAMHDLAVQAHRVRNEVSDISGEGYNKQQCKHLIDQVQQLALSIANDKQGTEIKTEMDYKNVTDERI